MKRKLKIFCDFDGTITRVDAWIKMGEYFIRDKERWYNVISKFENMEIGARECFLQECSLVENFDVAKFDEIIDNIELDSKFEEFADYCKKEDFPIAILSEGMDYYISRILSKHGQNIPYYANRFVLREDSEIGLEFPYSDSDCTRCGCCKRNLLMNMTGDDKIAVLIGDGFSDVCAANYADIVFAKKSLASYCWKNNITYFDYRDFGDVKNKLQKILETKSIKQRQNARVNRKDVYLRG